jgi:hypothetical protein
MVVDFLSSCIATTQNFEQIPQTHFCSASLCPRAFPQDSTSRRFPQSQISQSPRVLFSANYRTRVRPWRRLLQFSCRRKNSLKGPNPALAHAAAPPLIGAHNHVGQTTPQLTVRFPDSGKFRGQPTPTLEECQFVISCCQEKTYRLFRSWRAARREDCEREGKLTTFKEFFVLPLLVPRMYLVTVVKSGYSQAPPSRYKFS